MAEYRTSGSTAALPEGDAADAVDEHPARAAMDATARAAETANFCVRITVVASRRVFVVSTI
jgi:hypothetical protein